MINGCTIIFRSNKFLKRHKTQVSYLSKKFSIKKSYKIFRLGYVVIWCIMFNRILQFVD